MNLHALGQFELRSGQLILSDPCYEAEGQGLPAIKGVWDAYVVKTTLQTSWGEDTRCAFLFAHLSTTPVQYDDAVWVSLPTGVGVDSGQAGIFDSKFYRDEKVVTETIAEPLTGDSRWYDLCCDRTIKGLNAGVIPYGCVSSSGWGDGFYAAFGVFRGKHLVAVAINFQVHFGLMPAMTGMEKAIAKLMKENNVKLLRQFVNQALSDTSHVTFDAEGFVPELEENQPSYTHFNDLFFVRAAQYTRKDEFLLGFMQYLPNAGKFVDIEYLVDNKQIALLKQLKPYLVPVNNIGVLNALMYLRDEETALQLSNILLEIGINPNPAPRFEWEEPFIFKLFNNNDFQPALAEFWLQQGVNPLATHEEQNVAERATLNENQLTLWSKYVDLQELPPAAKAKRGRKKKAENVTEAAQEPSTSQQVSTEQATAVVQNGEISHELEKLQAEVSDILQEIANRPKRKKAKKGKKDKEPSAKNQKDKAKKSKSKNKKRFPKQVLLKTGNFKNLKAKVLDSDGKFYLVEIDLFGTAHQQEVRIKNTKILKK